MPVNIAFYKSLQQRLLPGQTLVAVSKFKSIEDIKALYDLGHRDFGENFVQELLLKQDALPKDIRWHFIGHLQTNKVKYIAPFIYLIQGVDTLKLLTEINKQAEKVNRKLNCLLQLHIAQEETKFGFNEDELQAALKIAYENLNIKGLMGMASFTEDKKIIIAEFENLLSAYKQLETTEAGFDTISMGMSNDYELALQTGSNMIRIGSLLFGNRQPM